MRKAGVGRQGARMAAREQVEDQAGEDDADPAGRDQPQIGPQQAEQERRGGAREQQQDRAAGRVDHRGTSSRSSRAATTSSTLRPSTSAAADRMTRRRTTPADRKSTRLNSSHECAPRLPSSAGKKKAD